MIKWIQRLQKYIEKPWYPIMLAFLAALDLFVVVIPTDGLLITSVMLTPRRWLSKCIWLTAGSVLGGFLFALLVHYYGHPFLEWVMPGVHTSHTWQTTQGFMDRHGIWALFVVAASPLFQQPAIAIAALMKLPMLHIVGALVAGRLLKYLLFGYLASHAPRYLMKIKFIQKEIEEARRLSVDSGHK